jgi:hypothetical protein
MILTTSNVIANVTPTITTGVSTDLAKNITDRDFSVSYTSSDQFRLTCDFGSTGVINYIAVAGTNIEGNKDGGSRVRCYDGDEIISTINVSTNQVVVISFESRSFTNLRIGLFNQSGSTPPQLTYAAAGVALNVPNGGEQSGFARQFLIRNIKSRSTVNNLGAPIAIIKKRVALTGTLKTPNMLKDYSENEWQTFLDFAYSDHFFILEQEDSAEFDATVFSGLNPSAYLCYEPANPKATAHAQTRSLNNQGSRALVRH